MSAPFADDRLVPRFLRDASFAKALEAGEDTGPNPPDRGKSGSQHHVLLIRTL